MSEASPLPAGKARPGPSQYAEVFPGQSFARPARSRHHPAPCTRFLPIPRAPIITEGATQRGRILDHVRLMGVFRRLALKAGARIMEIYEAGNVAVKTKPDTSPVTIADEAADALIVAGLRSAFPDILTVTEEQAASHHRTADRFIIVDPLDGTREFIRRRGDFTVNIALVEGGLPVRGVVYAPARGRLFMTAPDGGAVEETGRFDRDTPGNMRTLSVSAPDNAALSIVASMSNCDRATEDYIARYAVGRRQSAGASLKFCMVAAGEADLYPRLGRTMEWDTAAGHAVLRGAGGQVARLDDHRPLTYGKPGYENPSFVAFAPGVALRSS